MPTVNKKKESIITCPFCGREYFPAELYVPSAFFGRPVDIDRDEEGHILVFEGTGLDTKESYECDGCGQVFDIAAKVEFKASMPKADEFSDTYTATLQSTRISLFEGLADDQD